VFILERHVGHLIVPWIALGRGHQNGHRDSIKSRVLTAAPVNHGHDARATERVAAHQDDQITVLTELLLANCALLALIGLSFFLALFPTPSVLLRLIVCSGSVD